MDIMTFEDWVKEELGLEAYEIEHILPEEQKDVKFTVSVDALIKLWNAGVENGIKGESEARAIIKGLLESCFGPTSKTVNYEIKSRAEQFLKEVG